MVVEGDARGGVGVVRRDDDGCSEYWWWRKVMVMCTCGGRFEVE